MLTLSFVPNLFGQEIAARTQQSALSLPDEYLLAASLYDRQQWEEAESAFSEIITNSKQSVVHEQALFYLGECQRQLGRFAEARRSYQTFLIATDDPFLAEKAGFRIAEIAFQQNDASSTTLFDSFLQTFPDSEWREYSLNFLGRCHLRDGESNLARAVFEQALRDFPDGVLGNENRFGLALALERTGELSQANRFFSLLANQSGEPIRSLAELRLAMLAAQTEPTIETAETLYDQLQILPPDEPKTSDGWLLLARTWFELQEYEKSLEVYDHLLSSTSSASLKALATHDRAMCLWRLSRKEEANETLGELATEFPDSPLVDSSHQMRAQLAYERGEFEVVWETYLNNINAPASELFWEIAARSAFYLENYERAIEVFENLSQHFPESSQRNNWNYYRGVCMLGLQRNHDALDCLQSVDADELDETLTSAIHLAIAKASMRLQEWQTAIAAFNNCLNSEPSNDSRVAAENGLLSAQVSAGMLKDAHQCMSELSTDSTLGLDSGVLFLLADLAVSQSEFAIARDAYQKIIDIESDRQKIARALSGIGLTHREEDDWRRAEMFFQQVAMNHGDYERISDVFLTIGQIAEEQNRWADAANAYRQASEHSDDESVIAITQLKQAISLRKLGNGFDLKRAQKILASLVNAHHANFPRDYALYELSWIESGLGNQREARLLLEEIVGNFPDSNIWPDAAYRTAQRLISEGQFETAKGLISKILQRTTAEELRARTKFLDAQIAASEKRWGDVAAKMQLVAVETSEPSLRCKAEYWTGEAYFQLKNYEAARDSLLLLQGRSETLESGLLPWSMLRLSQCHAYLNEWSQAKSVAQNSIQRFASFPQLYEFVFVIGRAEFAGGQLETAKRHFENVLGDDASKGTETAAQAQWRIGETLFLQERFPEAIRAYYRVESLHSFPYWQAASLLQAGKCQEKLGNHKQAVILYGNLIKKYPETEFAKPARQRLSAIERQVDRRSSVPKLR
ncbi:MAG: tetratricopeptide repeat protein [Pirellulaceae bacterium]